jgi:TolA-binding protein
VLAQLRRSGPSAPVLARATLLEAQTYRLERRPEQALALFERVARGNGHEAEQARYLLAQTLARDLSDPKRAAAAWTAALKRFPRGMFHEEEIYRLGESQLAAEQTLEGIRTLSHYVKDFASGSHVEDAHLLVATAERDRLHDCNEAVTHFRAVATAGGRRAPQASIAEARCLRSLGRLPEARTAYLRYLSQAPRGRFAEEARAQAQVRRSGAD